MIPRVRLATSSDAGPIASLLTALGYPISAQEVPARLARLAGSRGRALVAVHDDRVIGLATFHQVAVLNRARDVTWITTLIVDEAVRGRGAGRALIAEIEREARAADSERISVTTYDHLTGAHAFYLRLGYEQTGRRFGKHLTTPGAS